MNKRGKGAAMRRKNKGHVLIVDDEESIRITFSKFLSGEGYDVVAAENYGNAVAMIDEQRFDAVFADIVLPDGKGTDILRKVKKKGPYTPVVMITGNPTLENAAEVVRIGAFDYIPKPVRKDNLLRVTDMAVKHKMLVEEREKYRSNMEAIFRSVKDAIISVDRDMVVTGMNDAAERICSFRRDVIGKEFRAWASGCGYRCAEALENTIKSGESVDSQRFKCSGGNGQERIISFTTSPLLDSVGSFTGAVLVLRDETRLDYLEHTLHERRKYHNMIGESEEMQKIYSLIENLTDVDTTVLVTGESGTGKELVAEALHHCGFRSEMPLVKVNCSALSENLLESELFGHVKGAFTGAYRDKIGRLEMARGGTIFFDEIGDISHAVQVRLLRVLQEKEFERVGDTKPIKVDVRIIAATNKDLRELVREGSFREDLYYRLKVVEILLPSLRQRRSDIPLLVDHFIRKFSRRTDKRIAGISDDVMEVFMNYQWPGNVRELEHALEHAFIVCRDHVISREHLPNELKAPDPGPPLFSGVAGNPTDYDAIVTALKRSGWNKAKAARLLGINRRTVYRKMKEYGISDDGDV